MSVLRHVDELGDIYANTLDQNLGSSAGGV